MMLVNSISRIPDDTESRIQLRDQLNACGLQRIMDKMMEFNNDQLKQQILIYKRESENDNEDLLEIYNEGLMDKYKEELFNNMDDPRNIFETILNRVEGTEGYSFFLNALKHMLLIQDQHPEE